MDGLWWKTLWKWMIWGYHYFRKHPYRHDYTHLNPLAGARNSRSNKKPSQKTLSLRHPAMVLLLPWRSTSHVPHWIPQRHHCHLVHTIKEKHKTKGWNLNIFPFFWEKEKYLQIAYRFGGSLFDFGGVPHLWIWKNEVVSCRVPETHQHHSTSSTDMQITAYKQPEDYPEIRMNLFKFLRLRVPALSFS